MELLITVDIHVGMYVGIHVGIDITRGIHVSNFQKVSSVQGYWIH